MINNKHISEKLITALVTGASSGIGAATARVLASKGMRVILVARRLERLNDLKTEIEKNNGTVAIFPADLTREDERLSLFEKVNSTYGQPDVLINNAGAGWYGYYSNMHWETTDDILALNISASMHLTHLFLPGMLARGRGHIINIGSIAGSFPNQGVAIYSATKSFLDAFTSSLYREVRSSGIHVSVVRAGAVATEFSDSAASRTHGRHLPTENMGVTAEKVADRIWSLIRKPRKVIYIPRYLSIVPWVELIFGWLVDMLGPLLLKYRTR
ncbi:SDR family NAD(P)-dependent oxidoreductase [Chloroflexota bacterium]